MQVSEVRLDNQRWLGEGHTQAGGPGGCLAYGETAEIVERPILFSIVCWFRVGELWMLGWGGIQVGTGAGGQCVQL